MVDGLFTSQISHLIFQEGLLREEGFMLAVFASAVFINATPRKKEIREQERKAWTSLANCRIQCCRSFWAALAFLANNFRDSGLI
jgi:hypothetical protein